LDKNLILVFYKVGITLRLHTHNEADMFPNNTNQKARAICRDSQDKTIDKLARLKLSKGSGA